PRWVLFAMRKLRPETGGEILLVGLDIEDRKRAEQELEIARQKAQETARLADLGTLAGGLSHEINNPHQVIRYGVAVLKSRIRTSALKSETFKGELERILDSFERSVDRVSEIIENLGMLSRNASNDPFELVAVRDLIKDVETVVSGHLSTIGARLRT